MSYRWAKLRADFAAPTRVPAVLAAAELALTGRGYSIATREVTSDRGRIDARPPHASSDDDVTIIAEASGDGTHATIEVGQWGDEALSRAILDAMLVRLGL